ncbi:MAG: Cytosine deaminase, partial [uncultured Quadrisphaera sp.]
ARATAAAVARAGVSVVALPQTNLFLQGRGVPAAVPRGLTAVRALLDARAVLAAGGDNVRDPFNPMGRSDACEAASLLVSAGHLSTVEAWHAVSSGARRAMGLPEPAVAVGAAAELLALRAESLDAAVAGAATQRLVFSRGRLLARTRVEHEVFSRDAAVTSSTRR